MITKEQFFKEWDFNLYNLPYGAEQLKVRVAEPKGAKDKCWELIKANLDIDELTKISNDFSFNTEEDWQFELVRKKTERSGKE